MYNEGSQVIISKHIVLVPLRINFVLANTADTGEMPHNAAFHLDFDCMPKYAFRGFCFQKVKLKYLQHLHKVILKTYMCS